jgi:uncharacterized protein (TIGR00251 family)
MKIAVVVKTNARKNGVETRDDGSLLVRVNAPPVEGKANEKVVEALAEHFGKPKRDIVIIRGHTSKKKLVEIH